MYSILREPDLVGIDYENEGESGAQLRFEKGENLKIYLKASGCGVRYVRLRWAEKTEGPVLILGDDWERLYGKSEWRGIVAERVMPWYMLVQSGSQVFGAGVKVRPNALCYWQLDRGGITLVLDVRAGGEGVRLEGRELFVCEVVSKTYENIPAFEAAKRFCRAISDGAVLPKEPVYGSNNWYYAYGNSSHKDILQDSQFVADMTPGISNRPFMVIDDGWSPKMTCGPWDRGNERFPDMARLAREMKEIGVKPGIWIRSLYDDSPFSKDAHTLGVKDHTLDLTDPAVLQYVTETVTRIKDWGFKLLKHDYTSVDIFGDWGMANRPMRVKRERRFMNNRITTAEATKTLYKTIFDAAEGMDVIGCNCVNHLVVGYAQLNRVGDDNSGVYWDRTRLMGVNALAFRLCQDESFFKVDADCVGLTADVPWDKNKQWLDLLARSGTPLFVSAKISDVTEEMKTALKAAFALAAVQKCDCEPLDWMNNTCPAVWRFNDEKVVYNWDEELGVDTGE